MNNNDKIFVMEIFCLLVYVFLVGCVLCSLGVLNKSIKSQIFKMYNVPVEKGGKSHG